MNIYGISQKAASSNNGSDLRGTSRSFSKIFAVGAISSVTKAAHRTAQGNPTQGVRYCILAGNKTPLVDMPTADTEERKRPVFEDVQAQH